MPQAALSAVLACLLLGVLALLGLFHAEPWAVWLFAPAFLLLLALIALTMQSERTTEPPLPWRKRLLLCLPVIVLAWGVGIVIADPEWTAWARGWLKGE